MAALSLIFLFSDLDMKEKSSTKSELKREISE